MRNNNVSTINKEVNKEVWRKVVGFPFYEVSNKGNVRRISYITKRGTSIGVCNLKPKERKTKDGVIHVYYILKEDFLSDSTIQKNKSLDLETIVGQAFVNPEADKFIFRNSSIKGQEKYYSENIITGTELEQHNLMDGSVYLLKQHSNDRTCIGDFSVNPFVRVKVFFNLRSLIKACPDVTDVSKFEDVKNSYQEEFVNIEGYEVLHIRLSRNTIIKYNLFYEIGIELERFVFVGSELKDAYRAMKTNCSNMYEYYNSIIYNYKRFVDVENYNNTHTEEAKPRRPLGDSRMYKVTLENGHILFNRVKSYDEVTANNSKHGLVYYLVGDEGFLRLVNREVSFVKDDFTKVTQFHIKNYGMIRSLMQEHNLQLREIPYKDSYFYKVKISSQIKESGIIADDDILGAQPTPSQIKMFDAMRDLIYNNFFNFKEPIEIRIGGYRKKFTLTDKQDGTL
jgi:hypothetical protein